MSSFTKYIPLQPLPDGKHWKTVEDFEYHVGSEESKERIYVPRGFTTDLASIPRPFWSIIGGPWGKYGYAAIVHDYLYKYALYPRKRCDEIFLEAMEVLKVPAWKRNTMFWAVRTFAWPGWNKHRRRE